MKIGTTAISILMLLIVGCKPADRHFWYPVALKQANCTNFTGEVYLMTNSIGWRSWPYYLEKTTKKEIELGSDCVFRLIKKLPEHKVNIRDQIQDQLTHEQQQYLIEGFSD